MGINIDELLKILPQLIRENDTVKGAILTALSGVVATRDDILHLDRGLDKRFEAMQQQMDKRFAVVDKRFAAVDKRFEAMQQQMDKRFEAMQQQMDKRFDAMQQQMDKRFEAMQQQMDKRFDLLTQEIDDVRNHSIALQKVCETNFKLLGSAMSRVENAIGELRSRYDSGE